MPGHVGQNDTDFTRLQEKLNAPISMPLRPNFALAPILTNFGAQPLNGWEYRGKGSGGSIDLFYIGLLACTSAKELVLKIGEILGVKIRGPKWGLVCGLIVKYSG